MDIQQVLAVIEQFREVLIARGVEAPAIVLFGSQVTGTAREDSDIDVAVISRTFADRDFWQRIDLLSDAIYEVFQPIEAVAFSPDEWESGESMMVEITRLGRWVRNGRMGEPAATPPRE